MARKPRSRPSYAVSKSRLLTTPEGVDLHLEIASFGARMVAYTLDIFFIYITIIFLAVIFAQTGANVHLNDQAAPIVAAFWTLLLFVLRNFWFIIFEMGSRGATPGKRIMRLRVTARDGGRLEAGSVVARNLLRDVEVFLPLVFIVYMSFNSGAGWAWLYGLLGAGWTLLFLFFPMFNRDRMRAGDLLGGTWVIRAPRARILRDLRDDSRHFQHYFQFTPEQVAVYGAFEIQTLEKLLRGRDDRSLAAVADTIRAKIDWPDGDDNRAFLQAYYAAVRTHLEKNMLFGQKRANKYDPAPKTIALR